MRTLFTLLLLSLLSCSSDKSKESPLRELLERTPVSSICIAAAGDRLDDLDRMSGKKGRLSGRIPEFGTRMEDMDYVTVALDLGSMAEQEGGIFMLARGAVPGNIADKLEKSRYRYAEEVESFSIYVKEEGQSAFEVGFTDRWIMSGHNTDMNLAFDLIRGTGNSMWQGEDMTRIMAHIPDSDLVIFVSDMENYDFPGLRDIKFSLMATSIGNVDKNLIAEIRVLVWCDTEAEAGKLAKRNFGFGVKSEKQIGRLFIVDGIGQFNPFPTFSGK